MADHTAPNPDERRDTEPSVAESEAQADPTKDQPESQESPTVAPDESQPSAENRTEDNVNSLDTPPATEAEVPVVDPDDVPSEEELAEERAEAIDEADKQAGKHVVAAVPPAPSNPGPDGKQVANPSRPELGSDPDAADEDEDPDAADEPQE